MCEPAAERMLCPCFGSGAEHGPHILTLAHRPMLPLHSIGGPPMPRFVIERTFPDDQRIPAADEHAAACLGSVKAGAGVTWVRSYVSADKRTSFCVFDGPDL